MQKKKRKKEKSNSCCYTCFKICVQMFLPTMTCFDLTRRWLWSPADSCLWEGDLSRSVTGFGTLIKCSEKDTISPNSNTYTQKNQLYSSLWCCFARCLWKCSLVSGFLLCAIFLLASRYNKIKKKERQEKKKILFQGKQLSLKKCGPKLQSRARGSNSGERN